MQNLNSDQLRRQLDENNAAMNTLADNNQKIVELLSLRGLKAINSSSDLAEIRALLEPERRADTPLTTDELLTGGWWCADVSEECANTFKSKYLRVFNSSEWGDDSEWGGCLLDDDGHVTRGFTDSEYRKQIHRIGGDFYWGAP